MHRAFVSYSRADLIHVISLVPALRKAGIETWIDIENLKPGERWKEAIEAALARMDAMIFCMSPLSLESAWTSVELKCALERGVKVIPLMMQRVEHDLLPPSIRERHILDMEMWPADKAAMHSAKAIAVAMGAEQARPIDYQVDGSAAFWTIWISLGETAVLKEEIFTLASPNIERIRHWHIKAITASVFAELLVQTKQASCAFITVDEHADPPAVNVLIGAVAARLGEWRVTVIESSGIPVFRESAALSRARYVFRPRGVAR
jgi:TIR domain